jgi:hypothetical protein
MFRISSSRLFPQGRSILATATRTFGTKPPGADPLELIRKECLVRNLCDEHGYRRPGVHWVFSVAVTPDDPNKVGIYRIG